ELLTPPGSLSSAKAPRLLRDRRLTTRQTRMTARCGALPRSALPHLLPFAFPGVGDIQTVGIRSDAASYPAPALAGAGPHRERSPRDTSHHAWSLTPLEGRGAKFPRIADFPGSWAAVPPENEAEFPRLAALCGWAHAPWPAGYD